MEKVEIKNEIYLPSKEVSENAHVKSMEQYKEMYSESMNNPDKFWQDYAKKFYFKTKHEGNIFNYNFDVRKGPIFIKCMEDAVTNICYNCLDVHVKAGHGDVVAFYWEGNDPMDTTSITYSQLLTKVCKFSNVLKSLGVQKGDRVAIYMPMILELVVAMLSCVRIGAMHSIVFGGFSAESLSSRILDARCNVLVTADGSYRGCKVINLKEISNKALQICKDKNHIVDHCIVVKHITANNFNEENSSRPAKRPCDGFKIEWNDKIDKWWHDVMNDVSDKCDVEWMKSEDDLFMLYTSGSTGKPKGVVHHVTGYMLWASATHHFTFDYHPGDVYFCAADIGWITGHTYITYGPLLNRATSVMFEGIPTFPNPSRYWAIIDKYKVSRFYTAPTAIRSLMKYGKNPVEKYKRDSLRVLGTVGEPINPEAWLWYYNVVGASRCSIVDTFWQTETGGHVMTPLPGCTPMKAGSATFPFFGVEPVVLDEQGVEIKGEGDGYLVSDDVIDDVIRLNDHAQVFKRPWPGIMRTVYGDQKRFEKVYFERFPGYYVPGDGCHRDADGYYWITGRIDDMMNVSGEL